MKGSNLGDLQETNHQYSREPQGGREIKAYFERAGFAVLILLGSLAVAAALVAGSLGLNYLMGLAFGQESEFYQLFRVVSSVFLIGAGLTIAAISSIVAVWDTVLSLWGYIQMSRGRGNN